MPNQSARASIAKKGAGPVAQSFGTFEHNRASGARLLETCIYMQSHFRWSLNDQKCLLSPKADVHP